MGSGKQYTSNVLFSKLVVVTSVTWRGRAPNYNAHDALRFHFRRPFPNIERLRPVKIVSFKVFENLHVKKPAIDSTKSMVGTRFQI